MSDPSATILGMEKESVKYTFVCDPDECDTLIEVTCASGYDYPKGVVELTCPCGRNMSYISATIQPITNEKEKMEKTTNYLEEQVRILQDTLKNHKNCDYWKNENGRVQSQLIDLVNNHYNSYNGQGEAEDIITAICEIIDYEPKKEIEFTATIRFTGRMDIPAGEYEGFDLTSALEDVYVDINNGDIVIDGYELEDAEEC